MKYQTKHIIDFFADEVVATVEHDFLVSGWFTEEDIDSGRYDDTQDEYYACYRQVVATVSEALGPPCFNDGMAANGFPQWYEAEFLAYWTESQGCRYVALRHDNKECPFAVVYGFKRNSDM
jgi:hypothetical protein